MSCARTDDGASKAAKLNVEINAMKDFALIAGMMRLRCAFGVGRVGCASNMRRRSFIAKNALRSAHLSSLTIQKPYFDLNDARDQMKSQTAFAQFARRRFLRIVSYHLGIMQ
jgi:hypothetical protein